MALVSTQKINATYNADPTAVGLSPALTNAMVSSQTFTNTGREFIYCTNSAGTTAMVVTVNNVALCDHGFDHDVVFNVPAGAGRMVGPFPVGWFGSTVTVTMTGGETTKTMNVFQLPAMSPGGS